MVSQLAPGYEMEMGPSVGGNVPALLSNGEFRIPAAAVMALGNGSIEEGSERLYDLMRSVRSQYRSAKADDIPPKAKSPLQYIKSRKK
jgi:hypothetical protein